ncbi:hydrogenase maturation nickel metallochaperone HypA/HybF [Uliginosibacterium aquaticum]|uniref:Hydrogenase maturation factor HypA n=1 Tax=Uliginosibacterium aquaticum TaxID=2731212 RepID=A0ABX2IIU5_9RHOO|nr:hydrogenase maturation nickel metallochaperone HypA [Uliginosibacterium aquaticum]NSL56706.1 hydrogenase maturation nickel metallochaperone HypA [Uliginosibacterium aquaticum]
MHELALCRALITSAERELANHPGRQLRALQVSVGALSGCEPDLLTHLFPHASPDTSAAGAKLEITFQPARVRCTRCGQEAEVAPNALCCPACGSPAVQLIAGDGVLLTGLILREDAHVQ